MHTLADLKVPAGSVAIHWFEQSTFALKDAHGTIVQIDPYFPRNRPAERFIHAQPPLDEADLPTNYILLTHDHGDHTCVESIERIQQAYPQVRVIGPEESIDRVLSETKVKPQNTTTIMAGDSVEMDAMTAYVVYAKPPAGDPAAGALAQLDRSDRFGWLTAPSSTIIQSSEVHTGLTREPGAELQKLFASLVL